jgi:hypothetical protein
MTFSFIGADVENQEKIYLSQKSRRQQLLVQGGTGTGKSVLYTNLTLQDIKQGLGVGVLDPTGNLINAILARVPPTRIVDGVRRKIEDDIILLDITNTEQVFGLNLFSCSDPTDTLAVFYAVEQLMHIFQRLYGISRDTPHMIHYLRNMTYTLIYNQGYTMAETLRLLTDEPFRRRLFGNVAEKRVRAFWQHYDSLKQGQQAEEISSIINKLDEFLQPILVNIVGQSHTTINMRQILDERKILLVKLDSTRLPTMTSLIGSIIIALVLNAARSREDTPEDKRKQWNLYADEFQNFATEDFAKLFAEVRQFGVTVTIAHQSRYQPGMDDANRETSLQAGNMIILRISGKDATELAKELDTTPPQPPVTGRRPIKTITHDPIGQLLRQGGHTNPVVNDFVQWYLLPANTFLHSKREEQLIIDAYDGDGFLAFIQWTNSHYVSSAEIAEAFGRFNRLFYDVMTTKNPNVWLPPELLILCSKFCGFKYLFAPYFDCLKMDRSRPAGGYLSDISLEYQAINAQKRLQEKQEDFAMLLGPDIESYLADAWNNLVESPREPYFVDKKPQDFVQCIRFLRHLRAVLSALAQDPILVDSGQMEDIYDRPRMYSDVQSEIANILSQLPNYRAIVKMITDNGIRIHTVDLASPDRPSNNVAELTQRIIENNVRMGYLRPRKDVEADITARQPPPPPAITKKHPL